MANLRVSQDIDLLLQSDNFATASELLNVPHNTDAVIICNQGDNIQDKWDEAAALTPNGNPLSPTNLASLIVMSGTYGSIFTPSINIADNFINIVGIGSPTIEDISIEGGLSANYATIEGLELGTYDGGGNYGTIKNIICSNFVNNFTNYGLIENVKSNGSFYMEYNDGIGTIKNVNAETFNGSANYGTIKDVKCSTFTVGSANTSTSNIEGVKASTSFTIGTNESGTIKDVECGTFSMSGNYGNIENVNATNSFNNPDNAGTIKNCKSPLFLGTSFNDNDGIIDNCHSTSTSTINRSFGGNIGSSNRGTIKNCTAKGDECFGQQDVIGVTEYCTSRNRGFAGVANNLDFSDGRGVQGTYRNCVAGSLSFLGNNNTTDGIKTIEATYVNCTAGANSFGFVNTTGAETHFSGTAINCISGVNGFFSAGGGGGSTQILAGAVIENCIGGGTNCFATNSTSLMKGTILRCRTGTTGANPFRVTGTGKVRLCLDGNYNEVNLG